MKYSLLLLGVILYSGIPTLIRELLARSLDKYLPIAILAYILATIVFLVCLPLLYRILSKWKVLTFLIIAGLGALLLVVAPPSDRIFSIGVDRASALANATYHLLDFEFPYAAISHLDNPITPFPGWIALAVPFSVLNLIPYINHFWLLLFAVAIYRWLGRGFHETTISMVLFSVVAGAPFQHIRTASDYLANNLAVATVIIAVFSVKNKNLRLVLFFLLGVICSSRSIFLIYAMPLVAAAAVCNSHNRLRPLIELSICAFGFLLTTLPIYFWDPANFTPLVAGSKMFGLGLFEGDKLLIPGLAFAVTILLSYLILVRGAKQPEQLVQQVCGSIGIAFFVLFTVFAIASFFAPEAEKTTRYFYDFGVSVLVFAWVGLWPGFTAESKAGGKRLDDMWRRLRARA